MIPGGGGSSMLSVSVCLCRYFQMVVGFYAAVKEETFLLTALVSERIIVRVTTQTMNHIESRT